MPALGIPKFDGVAVLEISVDFKGPSGKVEAVAAFVDTTTGETHGWTKGVGTTWSNQTKERLQALRESMEEDLAARSFGDRRSATRAADVGGLGEHLGTGTTSDVVDAPQT
jgi:hypothetical protein